MALIRYYQMSPMPFMIRSLALAPMLAAALAARQDDPVAAAEAELRAARAEREAAFEALESLILELEDDYVALTTSPEATRHRQALVLAMYEAIPAAQKRLAAEEARGRPVQRGTRRRALEDAFEGPVRQAAPVDPRLCLYVAQAVAAELARRAELDTISETDVLRAVSGVLPSDRNWWEFWNAGFHEEMEQTRRYAQAEEGYARAFRELERVEYPERFGPRGERAPPGMVIVPGGHYDLGPNGPWEREKRRVFLDPFAMDEHEVTQAEYALFVNGQPASARPALLPRGWTLGDDGEAAYDASRADHPVVYVSWEQAHAYAGWAGKRLPTEDEWEAAAAGIEGRIYPWGDVYEPGLANVDGREGGTVPVQTYPEGRSAAGCYEMSGNVEEWTSTLDDGTDIDELPDGSIVNVVIRGGSFLDPPDRATTRSRWAAQPVGTFSSPRYARPIGFRCVQDLGRLR